MTICSPVQHSKLFRATIGGLGLTGIIAWAEVQLKPIQATSIEVETVPFCSLDEFLALSAESDTSFEYTVAWIDCFSGDRSRGIFFRGNHSRLPGLKPGKWTGPEVPFDLPGWVLNRYMVRAFNSAYFHRNSLRRHHQSVENYMPFFYPLDSIRRWNRIYGSRGFLQYQCVIPEDSLAALKRILQLISRSGMGSFLGVLKRFGAAPSAGMLSFPRPGLTLALDFAMRGETTLQLMKAFDAIVLEGGGALYPAKDARMSTLMFTSSFPHWREFRDYVDPKLSSSFWRRVTAE